MRRLLIPCFSLLLSLVVSAGIKVAAVADASAIQASIAAVENFVIYEGLPHQMFERELMKKELLRDVVIRITASRGNPKR